MSRNRSARNLRGAVALYVLVTLGWRTWLQWHRTGDTGIRISPRAGFKERVASALIAGGAVGGIVVVGRSRGLGSTSKRATAVRATGLGAVVGATVLTARAQLDLGESWRIGVDESETTRLVIHGLFSSVRNPIYSGMVMAAGGVVLAEPTPASLIAILALLAGIELQVRGVEEPYLRAVHGEAFDAYVRATGRFVPRRLDRA